MWLVFAIISAVAAGFVSITIKIGMKDVGFGIGTFLRTVVVLGFTFLMVLVVGSLGEIETITLEEWIFIVLSGVATGLSWIFYLKALQVGSINKVVPVDRLSTVLTMVLAIIIFGESFWWLTPIAMGIMVLGTMLMISKKKIERNENESGRWLLYAILALVFASVVAVLARLGMKNVDSNLGTFLRTAVVLLMAFLVAAGQGQLSSIRKLTKLNWIFIAVSGVLTGISWLCYFAAIQTGPISVIVPIDKLSILITVLFSYLLFKEKLGIKALVGLALLTGGTLLLLV